MDFGPMDFFIAHIKIHILFIVIYILLIPHQEPKAFPRWTGPFALNASCCLTHHYL